MKIGLLALLLLGACASGKKSTKSPDNQEKYEAEEAPDEPHATSEECAAAIDHMGEIVKTDPGIPEDKRRQAIEDLEMQRDDLIVQCTKEATQRVVQCVMESKDLQSTSRCEN